MRRGMLDLPQPGLPVPRVVDDQVLAGILAADLVRSAGRLSRPRADFDRHGVGLGVVADGRLQDHGSKFRSQKSLWTVSPSGSVISADAKPRNANAVSGRSIPLANGQRTNADAQLFE